MTDHADTIRRSWDFRPYWQGQDQAVSEGRRALDAFEAERQQAIDALRRLAAWQAPNDLAAVGAIHDFARAALVKLGEKP